MDPGWSDDPVARWREVADHYRWFSSLRGCDSLGPMVPFAEWVAGQPFAPRLFAGTSHEWLTVGLSDGHHPGRPFIACGVRGDGQFACELFRAVGELAAAWVGTAEQAREVFREFVARLGAEAEPSDTAD